ncbi:hypothetical protein [Kitasatospora sp. NBC_01266]|uniref:hypothetical protein n=1 Tax=Kitasatospora sp. NBC_01266 TaxID=2903572 RepID=UPI002E3450B0|nr:hypothetical protein [Kitasatospora sp. NBC_01266]
MTQDETVTLIQEAIGYAIDGDADRAATALETLGQNGTNADMFGVCCAIATAGRHALTLLYGERAPGEDGIWAMAEATPGALTADPPQAFALRFLVAYSNGDTDTCSALFGAALSSGDEQYPASVCALLSVVADLVRLALAEKRAGRLPG